MKITIRGVRAKSKLISKSLSNTEVDTYKPTWLSRPVKIIFGFTCETDKSEDYGMMLYHRNRLIKAFEKVGYQKQANDLGIGVVGVAQVDFLRPIHNKQDFDKDEKYNSVMAAFAMKLNEYWNEKKNQEVLSVQTVGINPDWLWAQCDQCLKWRRLPDGIDGSSLPDQWFCRMNPDATHNRCDIPEEPEDEDLAVRRTYEKTFKKKLEERKRQQHMDRQRDDEVKRQRIAQKEMELKQKEETLRAIQRASQPAQQNKAVTTLQNRLAEAEKREEHHKRMILQIQEKNKQMEEQRRALLQMTESLQSSKGKKSKEVLEQISQLLSPLQSQAVPSNHMPPMKRKGPETHPPAQGQRVTKRLCMKTETGEEIAIIRNDIDDDDDEEENNAGPSTRTPARRQVKAQSQAEALKFAMPFPQAKHSGTGSEAMTSTGKRNWGRAASTGTPAGVTVPAPSTVKNSSPPSSNPSPTASSSASSKRSRRSKGRVVAMIDLTSENEFGDMMDMKPDPDDPHKVQPNSDIKPDKEALDSALVQTDSWPDGTKTVKLTETKQEVTGTTAQVSPPEPQVKKSSLKKAEADTDKVNQAAKRDMGGIQFDPADNDESDDLPTDVQDNLEIAMAAIIKLSKEEKETGSGRAVEDKAVKRDFKLGGSDNTEEQGDAKPMKGQSDGKGDVKGMKGETRGDLKAVCDESEEQGDGQNGMDHTDRNSNKGRGEDSQKVALIATEIKPGISKAANSVRVIEESKEGRQVCATEKTVRHDDNDDYTCNSVTIDGNRVDDVDSEYQGEDDDSDYRGYCAMDEKGDKPEVVISKKCESAGSSRSGSIENGEPSSQHRQELSTDKPEGENEPSANLGQDMAAENPEHSSLSQDKSKVRCVAEACKDMDDGSVREENPKVNLPGDGSRALTIEDDDGHDNAEKLAKLGRDAAMVSEDSGIGDADAAENNKEVSDRGECTTVSLVGNAIDNCGEVRDPQPAPLCEGEQSIESIREEFPDNLSSRSSASTSTRTQVQSLTGKDRDRESHPVLAVRPKVVASEATSNDSLSERNSTGLEIKICERFENDPPSKDNFSSHDHHPPVETSLPPSPPSSDSSHSPSGCIPYEEIGLEVSEILQNAGDVKMGKAEGCGHVNQIESYNITDTTSSNKAVADSCKINPGARSDCVKEGTHVESQIPTFCNLKLNQGNSVSNNDKQSSTTFSKDNTLCNVCNRNRAFTDQGVQTLSDESRGSSICVVSNSSCTTSSKRPPICDQEIQTELIAERDTTNELASELIEELRAKLSVKSELFEQAQEKLNLLRQDIYKLLGYLVLEDQLGDVSDVEQLVRDMIAVNEQASQSSQSQDQNHDP